jgi:hypothetical protein
LTKANTSKRELAFEIIASSFVDFTAGASLREAAADESP